MTLMIDFPFPGAAPWVEHFKEVELPVLRHTVQQLDALRADADNINTRKLAAIIEHDPLMTLRVYQFMSARKKTSRSAEITTIERALMMMGTQTFYDNFQNLPIIEQQLKGHPKALLALLKVIARSRHAWDWARDWAILRQNTNFDEIAMAALLHDSVELLMCCFAPSLAIRAREQMVTHPGMRTALMQNEVFGASFEEILIELCTQWGLPQLLLSLLNLSDTESANVRNVKYAVNLARHQANGWNDPALPDDYRDIEALLHMGHSNFLERIGAPDEQVQAARAKEMADDELVP